MPAPGAQYESDNIKNPFDETTTAVGNFTAVEVAKLQSRLNQQLGPEFVSRRQGPGGTKIAYLEGNKAIALANDIFGFNGWSSSLQKVEVDYVEESANGRINLGLSITVRVTLRDGTYHEDVGYGTMENAKSKGAAFEKAKKEAATDGLKRALRHFGNVLGNCMYDTEYIKNVGKVKVQPVKFNESDLHRHPDFALPPVKQESSVVKKEDNRMPMKANQASTTNAQQPDPAEALGNLEPEDEYGGGFFDEVELSEHPDEEYLYESRTTSEGPGPKDDEGPKTTGVTKGPGPNRTASGSNTGPAQPPMSRIQSMPAMRPPGGAHPPPQQQRPQNQAPQRPAPQQGARGPQTPNNARPDVQRPRAPAPTVDIHAPPKPSAQPQQQQNQPLRPTPPNSAPQNQPAPPRPAVPGAQPPAPRPVGFVTSRAAELVQNSDATTPLKSLPAFNPHADSPLPKDQRTPGIDHTRSMKITRESIGITAPTLPPQPNLPNQPQQQQPPTGFRPPGRNNNTSTNFVNPALDANRRIGMPAAGGMSPLANRSAYKPPGMVAAGVKRPPLKDVSNANREGEPEAKKQRVEGVGVENAGLGEGLGQGVGSS